MLWRDERMWIPVEITKVGEGSFVDAWRLGAETLGALRKSGQLRVTDVRSAWRDYLPVQPELEGPVEVPPAAAVAEALRASLDQLQAVRDDYLLQRYVTPLLTDPQDHHRRLRLAQARLEAEAYGEAIATLQPLVTSPLAAEALFHIGLSYSCLEDLDQAQAFITRALEADPERLSWRQTAAALQGLLARP